MASTAPPAAGAHDARFFVRQRVGRLIEARVFGLRSLEDVDAYSSAFGDELRRIPLNVAPILCADHRPVVIYSQPVTDKLVEMFQQLNARLERVAILAATSNATLVLQLQRVVRAAAYRNRRVFSDRGEAEAYLGAALGTPELQRMRDFLDELVPPSRREVAGN